MGKFGTCIGVVYVDEDVGGRRARGEGRGEIGRGVI
jgi:hypothetical protein